MRFTIDARAPVRARAFDPTTKAIITGHQFNVLDAYADWQPLQAPQFDSKPFKAPAIGQGAPSGWNQPNAVPTSNQGQWPGKVKRNAQSRHAARDSGLAAREQAERNTYTRVAPGLGSQS